MPHNSYRRIMCGAQKAASPATGLKLPVANDQLISVRGRVVKALGLAATAERRSRWFAGFCKVFFISGLPL